MEAPSVFPIYEIVQARPEHTKYAIHVLTKEQAQLVPEVIREKFVSENHAVYYSEDGKQTHYITTKKIRSHNIKKDTYVEFSKLVAEESDYLGTSSDLLSCHKYCRKSVKPTPPKISIQKETKDLEKILSLTQARNQSIEHSNGRGDEEGTPAFFEKLAKQFAAENNLEITVIRGDDLLKQGFRLMHAVGRGSINEPIFINLKYQGNPDSTTWVSYVGKGVCFDSGGLDIKPASSMKSMFLDKCGAVSVFTAFQYVVKEKVKINLTASMGFVENFISDNAYRPSDIITSRKGITVQNGNTDAEGRLVLADCMHWTQQKYKPEILIQLSTLTGAISAALGQRFAGLFTNNQDLKNDLIAVGKQIHEQSWHMPLDDYYRDLIKHKHADITNSSSRKTEGGSSQAAAFLENFVEKGTKWVHLDIAGVFTRNKEVTGFGARLLLQYARNYAEK